MSVSFRLSQFKRCMGGSNWRQGTSCLFVCVLAAIVTSLANRVQRYSPSSKSLSSSNLLPAGELHTSRCRQLACVFCQCRWRLDIFIGGARAAVVTVDLLSLNYKWVRNPEVFRAFCSIYRAIELSSKIIVTLTIRCGHLLVSSSLMLYTTHVDCVLLGVAALSC